MVSLLALFHVPWPSLKHFSEIPQSFVEDVSRKFYARFFPILPCKCSGKVASLQCVAVSNYNLRRVFWSWRPLTQPVSGLFSARVRTKSGPCGSRSRRKGHVVQPHSLPPWEPTGWSPLGVRCLLVLDPRAVLSAGPSCYFPLPCGGVLFSLDPHHFSACVMTGEEEDHSHMSMYEVQLKNMVDV